MSHRIGDSDRCGRAVRSYYRPSCDFAQSLGCVELPLSEAAQVWPYLTSGSLVTVTGRVRPRNYRYTPAVPSR